jgi:hypothetical protein
MDASDARDGADAATLSESADNCDLLFFGKPICHLRYLLDVEIMYYVLFSLSILFVLHLSQMLRDFLLILSILLLSLSGPNMTWKIPTMSNPTIQADTNPTVQKNAASDHEQADKEMLTAINLAKNKADKEAVKGNRIERTMWALLIAYGVLTLAIGLLTIWSNKQTAVTTEAARELNDLRMAKVKADAEYKIQIDTTKVREDAARDLEIKTEEVRGDAGKKIEEAKADAQVQIETAKAELTREQTKLAKEQEKTAQAQREAADAQLALRKHIEEVARRQAPRQLPVEKFAEVLRERLPEEVRLPIAILYQREDAEAYAFASQIASALSRAGFKQLHFDPLPPGAGGPPMLPTVMKLGVIQE